MIVVYYNFLDNMFVTFTEARQILNCLTILRIDKPSRK